MKLQFRPHNPWSGLKPHFYRLDLDQVNGALRASNILCILHSGSNEWANLGGERQIYSSVACAIPERRSSFSIYFLHQVTCSVKWKIVPSVRSLLLHSTECCNFQKVFLHRRRNCCRFEVTFTKCYLSVQWMKVLFRCKVIFDHPAISSSRGWMEEVQGPYCTVWNSFLLFGITWL